jgi:hypothetical protein
MGTKNPPAYRLFQHNRRSSASIGALVCSGVTIGCELARRVISTRLSANASLAERWGEQTLCAAAGFCGLEGGRRRSHGWRYSGRTVHIRIEHE